MMRRRDLIAAAAVAGAAPTLARRPARAAGRSVRIGVMNDMSGVYSDYQGRGSVIAAELAVADHARALDLRAEIVSADHQNRPDVGAAQARRWLDTEAVDLILDLPNSAIAFAVSDLCRQKNRVFIGSGAGSAELTGSRCSPNTVHWTYDTWSLGHCLGAPVVARGGRNWFLLVADYAFGYDLEASVSNAVRAAGGTVVGAVRHPLGATDYSSYLVRAQRGVDVLGLCNAGGDTVTAIKQAAEFGLVPRVTMVGPVININMIHSIGLKDSQGLLAATPFYWDDDEGTRAFARRFAAAHPRRLMPNDMQAGCYAATVHYLKAVAALGSAEDGRAVVERMKATPTDDPLFGRGSIRADGRKIHPVRLMEAKTAAESRGEWDILRTIATVPADRAYRPLADGRCPLVT